MPDTQLRFILEQALKLEHAAEVNCDTLLREFRLNGFHDKVEHIKNDEIRHQEIVRTLLSYVED